MQSGAVTNYPELTRLGNATRARMTQIIKLLAAAIQELRLLPGVERVQGEVCLRLLQREVEVMAKREQSAANVVKEGSPKFKKTHLHGGFRANR